MAYYQYAESQMAAVGKGTWPFPTAADGLLPVCRVTDGSCWEGHVAAQCDGLPAGLPDLPRAPVHRAHGRPRPGNGCPVLPARRRHGAGGPPRAHRRRPGLQPGAPHPDDPQSDGPARAARGAGSARPPRAPARSPWPRLHLLQVNTLLCPSPIQVQIASHPRGPSHHPAPPCPGRPGQGRPAPDRPAAFHQPRGDAAVRAEPAGAAVPAVRQWRRHAAEPRADVPADVQLDGAPAVGRPDLPRIRRHVPKHVPVIQGQGGSTPLLTPTIVRLLRELSVFFGELKLTTYGPSCDLWRRAQDG